MTITKVTNGTKEEILVEFKGMKFIMGWFAGDLYWIMLNYIPNNKFIVTKNSQEFFNCLTTIFNEYHFKNCTFIWNSEAGIKRKENKLKITKGTNYFKIKFIQDPDDIFNHLQRTCPICFCLSGSSNPKIAEAFSNLLHTLLNSD